MSGGFSVWGFHGVVQIDCIIDDYLRIAHGDVKPLSVSTMNHIVYLGDKSFMIFKRFRNAEKDPVLKAMLVSSVCPVDVASGGVVYVDDKCYYFLVSNNINKVSSDNSLVNGLGNLKKLHDSLSKVNVVDDGRVDLMLVDYSNGVSQSESVFLETIDYGVELDRRAFFSRISDRGSRLDAMPKKDYDSLRAVYCNFFSSFNHSCSVVHGDARIGNTVGGIFLDFDHMRRGWLEYDVGRYLSHEVPMLFPDIKSIVEGLDTIYNKRKVLANYLHHSFTLCIDSATNDGRWAAHYHNNIVCVCEELGVSDVQSCINRVLQPYLRGVLV